MRVFISWSGQLSQLVAIALKVWLKNVIQVIEPYVSSEDLEKGSRWFFDIAQKLDETTFGIVCLTRENMTKPWLLFEAGAVSKSLDRSRMTPLLIDVATSDIDGPLAQFQATTIAKDDMLRLVKNIGTHLNDDRFDTSLIEHSFEKWWPDFESAVHRAVENSQKIMEQRERRSDRAILEELLETTRGIAQRAFNYATEDEVLVPALDSITAVDLLKEGLEKRRKMLLVTTLEAAKRIYISGDEIVIEFNPDARHFRDVLTKSDNIRILRETAAEVLGKQVGFRIRTS